MSGCKESIMIQRSFTKEANPMSAEISDGNVYTETVYISTEDFPNICRLCLSSKKLQNMKNHLHLTDVIRKMTNIEVKRFDSFPQNICQDCVARLEGILEFINLTRNCYESLNKILQSSDEKRHICDLCPKSFAHVGALKRHAERHKEVQRFICSFCNRGFGRKNHLTHHLTTHTADKPYYCNTCSRGFATEKKLTVHRKQHSANKRLHCEVCPKKFRNMQELRQHTRYHTGDKPYSCTPCNKTFRQLGHLNLHLSTKHKNAIDVVEDNLIIEHQTDNDAETDIETEDMIIKQENFKALGTYENIEEPNLSKGKHKTLPTCVLCSQRFEVFLDES